MSKKTIIFQEYGKITYKEIDELFLFTIQYHNKFDQHNITKQSEFVVVAACRGLTKISLEKINQKDYLFISDDISNDVNYPKEIDVFLSMQCNSDSIVTAEMLYHAIYDSADELFPKMRLNDIYYNYKWLLNKTKINIHTNKFDKYIKDIFPNSKDIAIEKIIEKLKIARLEAITLFERWQRFHLIDYNPQTGWIPNYPKETLTIEQFKQELSVTRIDVKKDSNTGLLFFECDNNIKGEVMVEQIPKHPMMSKFILSNSKVCWILHEEEEMQAPVIADF